jgi:uncharacterized protein (TIGR03089 family)
VHQLIDSPEALFAAIVAEQPSRPFVTFYDDATGERSELSAKSLANWVAKTYFLLTDEYALGVGDRALVQLPAHWISVPVLLGAWTAGLTLDVAGDADVAFVEPATAALAAGVPDVVAIAPDTAARGFDGAPPEGTVDYILAVRPQPDAWSSVHAAASASDPAISAQTRGELVAAARQRAADLGLARGARVLTTHTWNTPADWVDALLVPLAVGGSLVILRNADTAGIERRLQQERATRIGS